MNAPATIDRASAELWRQLDLVGRLHELLSRGRNEDRLPALLTVVQPHLAPGQPRPAAAPTVVDLGMVRQLARLLGAARCPDLLLGVLQEVAPHLRQPGNEVPAPFTGDSELSEREVQVLRGMARGRTNAGIGSELGLSVDTVKTHARRMFVKLEAHDRAHAVARGYQLGILGGAA